MLLRCCTNRTIQYQICAVLFLILAHQRVLYNVQWLQCHVIEKCDAYHYNSNIFSHQSIGCNICSNAVAFQHRMLIGFRYCCVWLILQHSQEPHMLVYSDLATSKHGNASLCYPPVLYLSLMIMCMLLIQDSETSQYMQIWSDLDIGSIWKWNYIHLLYVEMWQDFCPHT